MATFTSSQTGNWSSSATWGGAGVPGAGDLAVIAASHTVTVDVDTTVGDKAAATGIGVTINGTNSTTFGTLKVATGVTLTLRGFNLTTAVCMKINQFAHFEPQPGSTILMDLPSSGASIIDNRGIILSQGTSGSRITWSIPAANINWGNTKTDTVTNLARALYYTQDSTIFCAILTQRWVSNAAGTAVGSFGDSSLAFSLTTPASILTTEVATIEQVTSTGQYWVDYSNGFVVWYQASGSTTSYTANYKYMTHFGGCIRSVQNTTYNEFVADYSDFNYLGSTVNADDYTLHWQNRQSASVGTSRRAMITNSKFNYCLRPLGIKACTGTAADPILIQNNQFNYCTGDTNYGFNLMFYRASNSYVTVDKNVFNTTGYVINDGVFGTLLTQTGFVCTNNIARCGIFSNTFAFGDLFPGAVIEKNYIQGFGAAVDSRAITSFGGTSANHAIIRYNVINRIHRGINYSAYLDITDNYLTELDHHGINAFSTEDDVAATDVNIQRNVFVRAGGVSGAALELGYNHRTFSDNFLISHNTIYSTASKGGFSFGDESDGVGPSINAKVQLIDNIIMSCASGIRRLVDTATDRARIHVSKIDYNNLYNNTADFVNYNKQGTFLRSSTVYNTDATRGCLGVALHNPSYASTFASKSLVFTRTSATDMTLAWDGGTAVQLVLDSGTASSGAINTTSGIAGLRNGSLTDTTKTWTTTQNGANSPLGNFVLITGGTGAGQARAITNNTATVLTVAPAWTTAPDATSTYSIIKTEAQLFDSGAVDYVWAGIDARDLPATSQTDSGISLAFNSTALNPSFVDTTRTVATWDASLGGTGTELGAWNRMVADPTLVYSSLLPYLQNGFKIQNATLNTAASDGTQVGAMGLQSSSTGGDFCGAFFFQGNRR